MISIEAAQTIQGIAGTATAVTYSIWGDEVDITVAPRSNTFKLLAQNQLGLAAAPLYTVPAGKAALIKSIALGNATALAVTGIKLYLGGTAAANQLTGTFTLPANGSAVYTGEEFSVYDASGALIFTSPLAATGDATGTASGGVLPLVLATVNSNVGSFGSASQVATFTVNAKGLTTAAGNTTITPAAIGAPSGSGTSTGTNTGDVSLAAVGSSPNANAATLTAQALNLQPASAAFPGVLPVADKLTINASQGRNSSLLLPRVFQPGEYMVGNTYDPTGAANSTSSFAAMMTAVIAFNDRCIIQLPPGVFKLDITVFTGFGSGSCEILGPGRGTCVLIPSATGDFITLPNGLTGSDAFTVKGFTIYNTSGTPFTTGSGINVNGCDGVLIEELGFVDLFQDISINTSAIKVSVQKTVHFQTNGSATSVGILISNGAAGDTYIGPDVVMSNGGATRRRASIEITETGHYEIIQANLTGSAQGILIDPGAAKIVAFGFHTNVLCDSCTVNGMTLAAGTATSTIKNIKSVNSWYSGTTAGAGLSGVVTSGVAGGIINGITHTSDRFLNNQRHGYEHAFGTDFRWEGCDMKGNNAVNAAIATGYDGLNVAAGVSNWSVNGGKFGGTDTLVTSPNQRYGINALAGAGDNICIAPSDLSGNRDGPLQMAATGTNIFISGCPGLAANKVITASVTVTAAQILIGNITIPKNSLRVGSCFAVSGGGVCTNTATTPGGTFTLRAGTTTLTGNKAAEIVFTGPTTASTLAAPFTIHGLFTVRTIGAGGTIIGYLNIIKDKANHATPSVATDIPLETVAALNATVAIDTTVANLFELTGLAATASWIINNLTITPVNY